MGKQKQQQCIYCQQVMDYMCHSAVIYKLACIVQIDCIKLESQQNGQTLDYDIYPYIENEFILLELITRNMASIKTKKDETTKQTEKEGLLKILDCIGLGLRFTEYTISKNIKRIKMHSPMMIDEELEDDDDVNMVHQNEEGQAVDIESIERLLMLILRVLTNVTNGRNVRLKPASVNSIFFLLDYYDEIVDSIHALLKQKESEKGDESKSYTMICLIFGCLINVCEKNKLFRNSFGELKINGIGAIDYLIDCFLKSRRLINEIKVKQENEEDVNDDDDDDADDRELQILHKAYMEYRIFSYYVALLIGFLLQNTDYFIYIAGKMDDFSILVTVLEDFVEFKRNTNMIKNADSKRSLAIMAGVIDLIIFRKKHLDELREEEKNKQQ